MGFGSSPEIVVLGKCSNGYCQNLKMTYLCDVWYCTFGNITGDVVFREDRYLQKILLASCRKAITKRRYEAEPPTHDEWLKIVNEIHDMDQLTHRLRTQEEQCREKWEKWTMFTGQRRDKKLNCWICHRNICGDRTIQTFSCVFFPLLSFSIFVCMWFICNVKSK